MPIFKFKLNRSKEKRESVLYVKNYEIKILIYKI